MAVSSDDDLIYSVLDNKISGSYIPTGSSSDTDASTPGAVISATSGGIKINLVLDAAAQAAPPSFKNGLQQAAAILAANITDQITVNIKIDYSGTGGGAAAGPDQGYYESYAWTRSELINNASQGDTTFNSLPNTATIQGQSQVAVWNAQLKLWGVLGANDTTTDDASAKFSTDINPNLLVGVALHELTHAWGRVPYGAPYNSQPDIFDFYRYTSPGVWLFNGAATAPAAYFSLDGGNTKIADYGRTSDPSDFLNSGVQGPGDPFNEFYNNSTIQGLTSIDLQQLDALGFHLTANTPTTIEAFGVTSLSRTGSYYFLNPTAGGGGPSLKYNGVSVVVGQYGSLAPIGAEQVGSGYDVVWKAPGIDQYTVWSVDSNGNYLSVLDNAVSGASYALESIETSFHQDLNGDGTIGVVTTVIESAGTTGLTQVANNYYFYQSGVGPELTRGGAPVVAGQFAPFVPIGVEKTSTGYDLAWKVPGADQYIVWNVDNSGNFIANLTSIESANSSTMESYETIFHQDFNGDGTIGVPVANATVIESAGTTSLTQVGSNYFFFQSGAGPELMRGGAAVVAGQFAPFVPIGVEKTSTGYDLAWKASGADQYIIWSV
ncbi:NF038122 family metalloprotease, partial [Bradyrhizobium sp. 1]|uniref:NF038122 family metalloprotease n=1 Tax=Bradyrhizobium sp. 1 TaxID=241591 RepID=UPI001FF7CDDB